MPLKTWSLAESWRRAWLEAGVSVGRRVDAKSDDLQRNAEILESLVVKSSRRKRLFLVVRSVDLRTRSMARLATRSSSASVLIPSFDDRSSFSTPTLIFKSSDHRSSVSASDAGRSK